VQREEILAKLRSIAMKLLTIYSVVNDEKFLVELIDDELTLAALHTVIQDRVKNLPKSSNGIILPQPTTDTSVTFQRLVFKNIELTSKTLPEECFRETQKPIHVVPYDLDPSIPFSVVVKVTSSVNLQLMIVTWNYVEDS
jgi:hypothetical protein